MRDAIDFVLRVDPSISTRTEARKLLRNSGCRVGPSPDSLILLGERSAHPANGDWWYRRGKGFYLHVSVLHDGEAIFVDDPAGWEVAGWAGDAPLVPDNGDRIEAIDDWFRSHGAMKWPGWDNGGIHKEWTRCDCEPSDA